MLLVLLRLKFSNLLYFLCLFLITFSLLQGYKVFFFSYVVIAYLVRLPWYIFPIFLLWYNEAHLSCSCLFFCKRDGRDCLAFPSPNVCPCVYSSLGKNRVTNIKWKAAKENILPQRRRKTYTLIETQWRYNSDPPTMEQPNENQYEAGKRAWQGPGANLRRRFDKSSMSCLLSGATERTEAWSVARKREARTER